MRLKNVTSGQGRATGFTLIELMIVVTIMAILALLGAPMYATFMANTQIRGAAESITGGLRFAQAEAVKRNAKVEFALDTTKGWQVRDPGDASNPLRSHVWVDGSRRVSVTAEGVASVQFDGLGRLVKPIAGKLPVFKVTTNDKIEGQRDLQVVVDANSGVKTCDAKLPSTDPAGCPQL